MGNADRRWWWYGAVEAMLCVILAVAFIPWYVALILPYDARYGSAGQVDMAFAVGCVLLLLGGAAAAALKVAAARRRESERRRAAEGLPSVMTEVEWPLSVPASGPVPAEASVEWPATLMVKSMVVVRTLFIAAFIGGGAIELGALLLNYVLILSGIHWTALQHFLAASTSSHRQSPITRPYPVLGGLAALGVMFAVVVSLVPTLAGTSRNPARVWADSAGLIARTLWGRQMQFLWNEIRLIEIHTEHTRATAGSGPIKTVSVEMQTGRRRIAILASSSEPTARLVRVASLVAAIERYSHHRTLTFDREDSRLVAGAWLDRVARQLGASLVLVAMAMADVSVAFGTSDRTNFTVSLIMMALVIGLGVWYIPRIGRPQAQKTSHGSTVSAIAMEPPWQPDPQALYEMTVGSYGLFRTTQGLCVVIGLSAAAIGGGVALNGLSTDHSHVWWGALAALVGIVITVISVRARDTVVIAQQGGLRKRWLLADTLIPWHDIASVTRRGTWYTVRARESRRRIGWPIVPFDSATQPQEPGAILLNPQQMAAVVEQRMGLTLQDERPL